MDLSLRTLDVSDVDAFIDVDDAAFSVRSDAGRRAATAATVEWPRMLGAFDPDGVLCGAAGAFSQTLTLPGGARLPVAGVTAVGVLPTHRRRGVLSALMARQLDDVAERGEALAVLTASEATIYGRFGYGVATRQMSVVVDLDHAEFAAGVPGEWVRGLVDDAEAIEVAPAVFDAHVASRPGGLTRPDTFWPAVFSPTESWVGGGEHFTVVAARPGGRPSGYAVYRVVRDAPIGHWRTVVSEVVAVDDATEGALWRYLLDVDLTSSLEFHGAPMDMTMRWRLADPRACRLTGDRDFLWLRVLDPVAALRARGYGAPGALVVELHDAFRSVGSGRYRLEVGLDGTGRPSEAAVTATTDEPDLTMAVPELGAVYLGGVRPSTLAAAGRIGVASPSALSLADRMFAAERVPYCSTQF
jgi:predicted acetyltransferase